MALDKQSYKLTLSRRRPGDSTTCTRSSTRTYNSLATFFTTFTSRTRSSGTISPNTVCTMPCNQIRITELVDRYNLQSPDSVSEQFLPWVPQHASFTINRYLVHSDGMTYYQCRWGVQYNAAICNFGKILLADIEHITVNKLAIKNNEQKIDDIWFGKTTNSGGHIIIATNDNNGKIFHTRSLTRMTTDGQWDKRGFENIEMPQMDTPMNKDYTEEDIGKAIIDQYFTETTDLDEQAGAQQEAQLTHSQPL
eukprot:4202414-Amphidinium_carterae.3